MATWYERHDSGTASMKRAGSSQSSSFKKVWIVQAGEDYTTAHEEFLATLDGFEGNLNGPYGTYYFNFEDYSAKHLGNGYWEVEAQYKTLGGGQQPNLGTVGTGGGGGNSQGGQPAIGVVASVNFETSGGTRRVTQAISDERYPADAPDVKKAINMIGDNVDGVDIVVPIFEWSEEYEIPGIALTPSYVVAVAELTGKVNDGAFRGFAAGEVLFLGVSGTTTLNPNQSDAASAATTSLSYRFAASPNKENLDVGDIEVTEKKGWDFMWVRYEPEVGTEAGKILKTPKSVYVDKVYDDGDFTILRLPGN